jgi:predicted ATPase/class 3 adenylate cyclase
MPLSTSEITDILEESLARYSGEERLLSGKTPRLKKGERRRVAVLFLDLTGFTSLSESMDHETIYNLISRIMGFLSSVVESFGGYVDKFEGDRLMALFGARVSAENDSARAVNSALQMLDILEDIGPVFPGSNRIAARIGIDFGSVTVAPDPTGHLTAMGITVNLASRIEEIAIPGTVLITDKVRQECGELFRFTEHGTVDVRGISSPVKLHIPLGPGSIQYERWQRAKRLLEAPMINRIKENEALVSALKDALGEKRKPVLIKITGEAGIGKSRLLHNFLESISDLRVLHGHARPYAQAPFWILIDLLRDYLNIDDDTSEEITGKIKRFAENIDNEVLCLKLKQVSHVIGDLLSLVRNSFMLETPDASQGKTVALRLMLDAISYKGAMILALEDVHLIDEPSMNVLRLFLESGRFFNPIMVVVTERPSEGIFRVMGNSWDVITLSPLNRDDICLISKFILSDDHVGRSFEGDLENLIIRGARGNPFYAEELVLGLLDSGGIKLHENNFWGLSIQPDQVNIPPSVQSIIQTRIDKLPRDERKILQLASVIGDNFRISVLKQVISDLDLDIDLEVIPDLLISKGFMVRADSGEVSFRHDLVQKSAYSTLLKYNRRIIHSVTAEALEKLYPDEASTLSSALFNHWRAAGDKEKTLEWALRALESACANDQNEEILHLSEVILNLASDRSDENKWLASMKALEAKQGVLARTGEISGALKICDYLLENAKNRNNTVIEAEALRSKCILLQNMGEIDEVEDLLKLALKKADEAEDEKLKGRVLGSLANYLSDTGKSKEALKCYEKALAVHVEHGEKCSTAAIYSNMANLLSRMGNIDEAEANLRLSIELNRQTGSRSGLGYALNGYAICKAKNGDLKEAGELFEEALECQIDIGNKSLQSSLLNNLGVLTKILEEYDLSLDYRIRALDLARSACNKMSECIALLNVGNLHRLMGHYEEALEFCRESRAIAVQINDSIGNCHALSIESMTEIERGDTETALTLFDKAVDLVEENEIKPGMVEDFDELIEKLYSENINHRLPSNWQCNSD